LREGAGDFVREWAESTIFPGSLDRNRKIGEEKEGETAVEKGEQVEKTKDFCETASVAFVEKIWRGVQKRKK